MKSVIMTREQISASKEYLIDPGTKDIVREIWENEYGECSPFWNEYYRVGIFDTDKYEDEFEALSNEGADFYSFVEAKRYYDLLTERLKEGE